MMTPKRYARMVWFTLLALSLLGVFASVSHYYIRVPVEVALAEHLGPSPSWYTEQLPRYDQHALITFLHLVPAALFVLFAPLQFSHRLRERYIAVHRLLGRLLLSLALLFTVPGILLGIIMPFDGSLETLTSLLIGSGLIICAYRGFSAVRRKHIQQHRTCMSYMMAFAYTPISLRIILAILSAGWGMDTRPIFAESMFAAMLLNLLLVYLLVQRKTAMTYISAPVRSKINERQTVSD